MVGFRREGGMQAGQPYCTPRSSVGSRFVGDLWYTGRPVQPRSSPMWLTISLAAVLAMPAQAGQPAQKLRIIVFGAHPDDAELKAGGTAAKWAKLGHQVKLVSVTNGDIGHWRDGRRAARQAPHGRGRRPPRRSSASRRGARHPRRRARADAGEPQDDHAADPRVEGRHRHRPPAVGLPPRPPLRRRAGAGRGVHGHGAVLLPRHAAAEGEPGLPLLQRQLPEAEPVPGRTSWCRSTT